MTVSRLIYGVHEPMPNDIMPRGWIVHLVEVGHSNEPHPGIDFSQWASYGNILRIQHAWGDGGTLPLPQDDENYIKRVLSLVQNSTACNRWIIGNEPNLSVEWPCGFKLYPPYVASIYDRCRVGIHALPGHERDEVLLCPVGPWNVEIGIDWISYFRELVEMCDDVDGFALHTYSRGPDPASITSEQKMDAPYQDYYNGFRTYRDWMDTIPTRYRDRPCYITETNQNQPWLNANTGWVREAYCEIDNWNRGDGQTIRALCLYRWPRYDDYYIENKRGVIEDFLEAQAFGYTWDQEPTPPPAKRTLEACVTLMVDGEASGTFVGTLEEL